MRFDRCALFLLFALGVLLRLRRFDERNFPHQFKKEFFAGEQRLLPTKMELGRAQQRLLRIQKEFLEGEQRLLRVPKVFLGRQ